MSQNQVTGAAIEFLSTMGSYELEGRCCGFITMGSIVLFNRGVDVCISNGLSTQNTQVHKRCSLVQAFEPNVVQ
jgi:hypothetical protein